MKRIAPFIILLLVAVLLMNLFDTSRHFQFAIGDEQFDGPLAALFALLLCGAGLLIGGVAIVCVALLLAVVFAGIGILLAGALALGLVASAAALAPLMLPLLIPIATVWFFMQRARRGRERSIKCIKAEAV